MLFASHRPVLPLLLILLVLCPGVLAQRRSARQEIEDKRLPTKDGVDLAITYYPSNQGKEAVPVVILHDSKGTRQRYSALAKLLWKPDSAKGQKHKSFAVVTVDLRGHGESVKQTLAGRSRELSASKLRTGDYAAMVTRDMEAVRKFLVDENDKGKLNLNRLSVIGIGLGAAVGMNWTAIDWAAPPLATGKQGQDVKTLVAVSPRWKQSGLSVQRGVRMPGLRTEVAVLMIYGDKDRRVNADVERIYKQLARDRETSDSRVKINNLMKVAVPTELQGDKLLKLIGDKGTDLIVTYLNKYSVEPELPWSLRRKL